MKSVQEIMIELESKGVDKDKSEEIAKAIYQTQKDRDELESLFSDDPVDDIKYLMGFAYVFSQMIFKKKEFGVVTSVVNAAVKIRIPGSDNHILGMLRGVHEFNKFINMSSERDFLLEKLESLGVVGTMNIDGGGEIKPH